MKLATGVIPEIRIFATKAYRKLLILLDSYNGTTIAY